MNFLKRLFHVEPYGRTLIHFECRGCMAHDWHELDRGVVVDRVNRKIYGSGPRGCDYWVVRREDGSTFEAYVGYTLPGTEEMQARLDNPFDPVLPGKLVYLT